MIFYYLGNLTLRFSLAHKAAKGVHNTRTRRRDGLATTALRGGGGAGTFVVG
jgi:hypothetical protein